jgi:hypothetical protein
LTGPTGTRETRMSRNTVIIAAIVVVLIVIFGVGIG